MPIINSEMKTRTVKINNENKIVCLVESDQEILEAKSEDLPTIGLMTKEVLNHGNALWGADYVVEDINQVDCELLNKVYCRHNNLPLTIAKTKRCLLREMSLDRLDDLFELYAMPGVTDYVEPLFEYQDEMAYQKEYIKQMYGYFEYGMWLVLDKKTGKLIGRAGLEHREYKRPEKQNSKNIIMETELEMGYLISPDYQRKGIATEVCKTIINYARDNTEYKRLNCLINEKNLASIKFAKSLGFKFLEKIEMKNEIMERYILNL